MITCNSSYRHTQKTIHNHLASYYARVTHFSSAFHYALCIKPRKSLIRGSKVSPVRYNCLQIYSSVTSHKPYNNYCVMLMIHECGSGSVAGLLVL